MLSLYRNFTEETDLDHLFFLFVLKEHTSQRHPLLRNYTASIKNKPKENFDQHTATQGQQ